MSWVQQIFQEIQQPGYETLESIEARLASLSPQPSGIRAALVGARATTPGLAFAAGLGAALGAMTGRNTRQALAATEAGGGHPKAIHTVYRQGTLSGVKTFSTLASRAEELVVIARHENHEIGAFLVKSKASGVTIEDQPPLLLAPEIPHARITLTAAAAEVLPGDGYLRYLKAFRTLEDVHVGLALTAAALRLPFQPSVAERLVGGLVALEGVSRLDPLDEGGHIALSGIFQNIISLFDISSPDWQAMARPPCWDRDVALLQIAGQVREKRRVRAWEWARASAL